MKMLRRWMVVALAISAMPAGADDNGVRFTQTMNGDPAMGIDIFSAWNNERVQESPWYAKPVVAPWESLKATGAYAKEKPGRFALTALGSYVVVRGVQGKLQSDMDGIGRAVGLWGSKSNSSDGGNGGNGGNGNGGNGNGTDVTQVTDAGGNNYVFKVEGDGNTFVFDSGNTANGGGGGGVLDDGGEGF